MNQYTIIKKILSSIVVLILISNNLYSQEVTQREKIIDAIGKKYNISKDRIISISPEKLEMLKNHPQLKGRISTREITKDELLTAKKRETEEYGEKYEPMEHYNKRIVADSIDVSVRATGSSGDGALAVFAIVGFMVVVIWIFYSFYYLFELLTNPENLDPWVSVGYYGSLIADSHNTGDEFTRSGNMYGIEVMSGIDENRRVQLGLTGQFGKHFIEDKISDTGEVVKYQNNYWLAGPNVVFGIGERTRGAIIYLDLMYGQSMDTRIKDMATARVGLKVHLSKSFMIGVNWGGVYFDATPGKGLSRRLDKYDYVYGANFDYHF